MTCTFLFHFFNCSFEEVTAIFSLYVERSRINIIMSPQNCNIVKRLCNELKRRSRLVEVVSPCHQQVSLTRHLFYFILSCRWQIFSCFVHSLLQLFVWNDCREIIFCYFLKPSAYLSDYVQLCEIQRYINT